MRFVAVIVFTASVLKRTDVFITNDNIAFPNASSLLKCIYMCVHVCIYIYDL